MLPNASVLKITEGTQNQWAKTRAALMYLGDKLAHVNYDYVLKIDDNAYVELRDAGTQYFTSAFFTA